MENKNDIEELEQLMRSTFRGAESQPPADAWQRVSERLSQNAKGASTQSTRYTFSKWLVVTGLVAAATAIITAVVLALPRQDDGQQAETTVSEVIPISAEETPLQATSESPILQASTPVNTTTPAMQPTPNAPQPASPEMVAAVEPADEDESPLDSATPNTEAYQVSEPQQPASTNANLVTENSPRTKDSQTDNIIPNSEQQGEDKTYEKKSDVVLVIPTLLTPNGDGYNDCWVIGGLDKYNHVEVSIYTAHSKRVYSSSDYRNDFCGDNLPKGNYFYVVAIRSEEYVTRGVLVIR